MPVSTGREPGPWRAIAPGRGGTQGRRRSPARGMVPWGSRFVVDCVVRPHQVPILPAQPQPAVSGAFELPEEMLQGKEGQTVTSCCQPRAPPDPRHSLPCPAGNCHLPGPVERLHRQEKGIPTQPTTFPKENASRAKAPPPSLQLCFAWGAATVAPAPPAPLPAPAPLRGCPLLPRSPALVRGSSTSCDGIAWSQQTPRLRGDPEKVLQIVRGMLRAYDPTWGDVQMLLEALFTHSILDANHPWAEQGGALAARTAWPAVDTGWNYNVEADYWQLQLARQGLEEAVRLAGQKSVNWSKIRECHQQPEERPSAFLSRLFKQIRMFGGGIDPEAKANKPLILVFMYVDQTASDIKKYFSKHVPDWPGKSMDKIVRLATFVYNDRDEKVKEKRRQKKEDVSVLAAVLRARGDRRNQGEHIVRLGVNDYCHSCGEQGHWKRECPVKPHVPRNRGDSMRQSSTGNDTRQFPASAQ
uniref:CCHC-type domain-containing protein n=1 Tax=Apteryx owenii TaxID=8824 RepID=A0A8B9QMI9_APTOW